MKKMSILTRVLTIVAALVLIIPIYFPIWRIELSAPQYPEGLYMDIWASKIGGNVDIINGLNHYIGMKTLHANEFMEFTVLPYIIWALVGLGFIVALLNKKKIFTTYFALFVLFAVLAMVDFYRWEYSYGHNLNPEAPIQVPGQSYQPPLIGYKQLLNFGAYSIPDKGGWAMVVTGVLLLSGVVFEWLKNRKAKKLSFLKSHVAVPAVIVLCALSLMGCVAAPESIRFGKDACDHCKMTIMDKKFGGEILTGKGRVYRFDDAGCLIAYMQSGTIEKNNMGTVYLLDYNGDGNFIKSDSAFLMRSDELHSPMGGNIAAFKDDVSRQKIIALKHGTAVTWAELTKQ